MRYRLIDPAAAAVEAPPPVIVDAFRAEGAVLESADGWPDWAVQAWTEGRLGPETIPARPDIVMRLDGPAGRVMVRTGDWILRWPPEVHNGAVDRRAHEHFTTMFEEHDDG
jgi:hypothetical protein